MHKIAFTLGPLTITWYGIFVASGFFFGLWNASRRALKVKIAPETIYDAGTWLLIGAVLGARAMYVVSYWPDIVDSARDYHHSPLLEIFMIQHGGLVYYGGLIGASLACVLFTWIRAIPLWRLADILAPGVALGSFFGRWGCLMNGCCYGSPTNLPWGIEFPVGHETHPFNDHLAHFVHPTEIYDSLLNLILFSALAWFYHRRKFDGQVFAFYLIGYAIFRAFVEYFRGDYPPSAMVGWATPAQAVSLCIFIVGLLLLFLLPRDSKFHPAETQA